MEITQSMIEAVAVELGGGNHWFYEYPNNDHDRKRYREEAEALLKVAQKAEDSE